MRVNKDAALEKSTYVTNFIVDEFSISTENTGGEASRINGKNEINNRRIQNMVRVGILYINQHEKNGVVQREHKQKYIDTNYIVN